MSLLIEQTWPLRHGNPIYSAFDRYAARIEGQLNAGHFYHGVLAWTLAVLPIVLLTVIVYHLLDAVSPILAWVWSMAVLYLTMGFRQFSHHFREIAHALRETDIAASREYLARWRGAPADELTSAEVARLSIELALAGSHRYVFGPIAAFIVFGPAGAVLYRLSAMLADSWGARDDPEAGEFGVFARRFFFFYDWVPSRVTAASFAVVGNFEDAVYCWRTQARAWDGASQGVLLASGGGALGVRLGNALHHSGSVVLRPELGLGDEADVDYMQSAIGLIWRALVLWMFLVFVVTVAHSLG